MKTQKELNKICKTIENCVTAIGTVKILTVSEREGCIYVNIDTKYNLSAIAVNLSQRTGLKYRIEKKTRTIKLLL